MGFDQESIRSFEPYWKPYAKHFAKQIINRRGSTMHQAAARFWNEVARTRHLKTEWARQMFTLQQEELDLALENEEKRLVRETSNPILASAYLKIMPLLWENEAISSYLNGEPHLRAAMLPVNSIAEATMIARNDFRLTARELTRLAQMLKEPPAPNPALRLMNLVLSDDRALVRRRHRGRAEGPRVAEALFKPSFEAATLLRVTEDSSGTTLALTFAEHLFGVPLTTKETVAPDCALQFWTELDAMLAAPFNIETRLGFDGATIKIDCRTPAGSIDFQVWCPDSTTQTGRLIGLIYDLARQTAPTASAVRCLERLHDYLRD